MEKAYKFRLYPTKAQQELMLKTFGCARFVYNQTLAARKDAYTAGKASLSRNDCVKLLPGLKEQYPWLREVDSTALQSSVKNMDRAYQNFFRGLNNVLTSENHITQKSILFLFVRTYTRAF